MKAITFIKMPRAVQTDMVCHTPSCTYAVELGKTLLLADSQADYLVASWPGCFEYSSQTPEQIMAEQAVEEAAEQAAAVAPKTYKTKKMKAQR